MRKDLRVEISEMLLLGEEHIPNGVRKVLRVGMQVVGGRNNPKRCVIPPSSNFFLSSFFFAGGDFLDFRVRGRLPRMRKNEGAQEGIFPLHEVHDGPIATPRHPKNNISQ